MPKKTTSKKTKKKTVKKKPRKNVKPFGGYTVNFKGQTKTLEELFGKKPITPSAMTKILWKHVKGKKLAGK